SPLPHSPDHLRCVQASPVAPDLPGPAPAATVSAVTAAESTPATALAATTAPALELGPVVHDGTPHPDAPVRVPLAMLNRHGLVAGATGTGKTKTLQGLAGRLSDAGVPCFVSDMKGDVSGMAEPGEAGDKVKVRIEQLQAPWDPHP